MYEHLVNIADIFEPPKYVLGIGVKMEDLAEEEKDALKMSQDYWDKHLISRVFSSRVLKYNVINVMVVYNK